MSFLKLSNLIINTSKISTIEMLENKYLINLTSNRIEGFMMFGSGSLSTTKSVVHIEKDEQSGDYEVVSKWIDNIK